MSLPWHQAFSKLHPPCPLPNRLPSVQRWENALYGDDYDDGGDSNKDNEGDDSDRDNDDDDYIH